MTQIVLYDYWRSSAAYRVRIALALKGLEWESRPIDLAAGAQRADEYLALNPQGLVPALSIDGVLLTQSLAIIDYLDRRWPMPALLPAAPADRARVLAQALVIAADTHPIQNLRVLNYLRNELAQPEPTVQQWARHWIGEGLLTLEQQAPDVGLFGGAELNLVDLCLVPQLVNARRFGLDLSATPRLVRIDKDLTALPAIARVSPEAVKPR